MSSAFPATPEGFVVLVVDDHELVGESLVLALAQRGMCGYRCPITSTADILDATDGVEPGLVLLDLDLGVGASGAVIDEIELIVGLRARGWSALVVSAVKDERRVAAAVAAGAIGYVSKSEPLEHLLDVVSAAAAGHQVLSRSVRDRLLDIDRRGRLDQRRDRDRLRRLTSRERQVLECLAQGERAATVASHFLVSLGTVRSQIRSILTKLDVNSQLEAVALLRRVEGDLDL
jgi:DNA-binding NarL/FixJ family response regulator